MFSQMKQSDIRKKPKLHAIIEAKSEQIGFTMPSDIYKSNPQEFHENAIIRQFHRIT